MNIHEEMVENYSFQAIDKFWPLLGNHKLVLAQNVAKTYKSASTYSYDIYYTEVKP